MTTFELNPTLLVESSPGTSNGNIDLSVLAQPIIAPDIVGISSWNSNINTSSEESLNGQRQEPAPTVPEQVVPIERVEALRKAYQDQGILEAVRELLLAENRPNTSSTYQSAWKYWRSWCVG